MNGLVKWEPKEVTHLDKLGDRVQQAQSAIPLHRDTGFPTAYIDATALAALTPADDPLVAAVSLCYLEGVPTVNGIPIWERLENEPLPEYELFKTYRDQPFDPTSTGTRSIARLAERVQASPKAITALAKLRHWRLRVQAFDRYRELEVQARRRKEIELMEGEHAKAAKQLFEQAMAFFKQNPQEMTGKVAVEALRLAAQLHRVSLGLPADKPASEADVHNHGTSRTVININAAQQNIAASGSDTTGTQKDNESRLFQILEILKQSGALSRIGTDTDTDIIDITPGAGPDATDTGNTDEVV